MYRVAIKDSAVGHNSAVRAFVAEHGTTSTFESRQAAEAFASELRDGGGRVRLQAAADLDPAPVDGYLVRDGQQDEWTPIECDGGGTTFPVGGNVYGALGMAIIHLGGTPSPALRRFMTERAGTAEDPTIEGIEREPTLPDHISTSISWCPDLRFDVSYNGARDPERFYAEVKAGAASFQRSQRRDMQRVAAQYPVLKIRVDLTELPDRYTVRIDEVPPDAWPD